jgi:hypothetical protein
VMVCTIIYIGNFYGGGHEIRAIVASAENGKFGAEAG